jgi:Peptidase family M1 domain
MQGIPVKTGLRVCPIALLLFSHAQAQSSAQELADRVSQQWAGGSDADFSAVYPFREARQIHSGILRAKIQLVKGLSSVIAADERQATLLLSGVPLTGNSGDDTIYGMGYSGVYESVAEGGSWRLERQIPLEDLGAILSHRLVVSVHPGKGLEVEDRLLLLVKSKNGFAARLNHGAKLQSVQAGGTDVRYQSGGGLLWIDLPPGQVEVKLKYSLEVESDPKDANSGRFKPEFGHVRNQYLWHPAFGFSSSGDQAEFQIEARIPKEYPLTTSIPQSDRIEGEERIVQGRTVQRTSTLTLAYDREWKPATETVGKTRLELFITSGFRPDRAAITQEFRTVYSLLASRFGEPGSGDVAVVELRLGKDNYFTSNQAIFAEGSSGLLSVKENNPSATLGHEIGHFWTEGSGPAANFLREGWAKYVESLVLEQEFGRDTVSLFWKQHARAYFKDYDGKKSMLGSENSDNLNYDKGSWVFRMLEDAVGADAFQKAMAEYSRRSLAGDASWETLADCFQHRNVPDFDARQFLLPWLKEKTAPRVTAQADGHTVTISQSDPRFVLLVTVEARTAEGTERHRVWIRGNGATVQFAGVVSEVRVDPDELLLLRR